MARHFWSSIVSKERPRPAGAIRVAMASLLAALCSAGCAASADPAATSDEVVASSSAGGSATDRAELSSAGDVADLVRGFDWEAGDRDGLERDLGAFYGVDGHLAQDVVSWAVWGSPGRSVDDAEVGEAVVVEAIENVTMTAEGTSGVLELVGDGGSSLGRAPFWTSGRDLFVSSGPGLDDVPADFGPELAADVDWGLPEDGIAVLAYGTVGFFTVDGAVVGHVPASMMGEGSGSLIDWLVAAERRIEPLPVVTGDHPCFEADLGAVGQVELCARQDAVIPSITVDGVDLVTERHWSALFEETGWSWEEMLSAGGAVFGHYRTVERDPASGAWLLDWSGECESRDALLFHDDRLEHVTGLAWEGAPSAIPVGWVDGSVVYTTRTDAICGTADEESAVYARPPDGEPTMIWSTPDAKAQALIFTTADG